MTPGWEKVQKSFFNAAVLAKTFPKLLDAFTVNIMIFAWSAPAIAVSRVDDSTSQRCKSPLLYFHLRIFGAAFTDIFRGVPVILTVYLIGFGIPGLGLPTAMEFTVYMGISSINLDVFSLCCRNFSCWHRQCASKPKICCTFAWAFQKGKL